MSPSFVNNVSSYLISPEVKDSESKVKVSSTKLPLKVASNSFALLMAPS